MNYISDKDIVRAIKNGDSKSFEKLFDKYFDKLFSLSCAILHDEDASEDILQNVFLKFWLSRDCLDENKSIVGFLMVSVRNEVYNYLRLKHNSARERGRLPEREDISADIESKIFYNEFNYRLREAVNEMPPVRQRVFKMSRYQYMTTREIADRLHLSERTVERHISLALKNLKSTILYK